MDFCKICKILIILYTWYTYICCIGQNEVTQLKAEMVELKTLLLAHRDCPITRQQQQSGQLYINTGQSHHTSGLSLSASAPKTNTDIAIFVFGCMLTTKNCWDLITHNQI